MKFVSPSFKIIENQNKLKTVEYCARLCYKSDDKIAEDSYKRFCLARFKEKHYAIFEHANFVFELMLKENLRNFFEKIEDLYGVNYLYKENSFFVNFNLRHIFEMCDKGDFEFYNLLPEQYKIFYPDASKQKESNFVLLTDGNINAYSVIFGDEFKDKFTFKTISLSCQRSVWDELARHRNNALCCESSRYCTYSKENFGGEISFSYPHWFNNENEGFNEKLLKAHCLDAEKHYMELLEKGFKAQDARYALPLGYNVNCVVTASLKQWKHILELRTSNAAHPDIKEIMIKIKKALFHE